MKCIAVQGDSIQAEADSLQELAEKLSTSGWTANEVAAMLTIFEVREIGFRVEIPTAPFEIVAR